MGIWVAYAKAGLPNLPKVIVVSEPVREFDPTVNMKVVTKPGIKIPTSGGVTKLGSKEEADLAKKDERLVVKYLEHVDRTASVKTVNAAVGRDLDAETKGKMSKPVIESDAKPKGGPDGPEDTPHTHKAGRRG